MAEKQAILSIGDLREAASKNLSGAVKEFYNSGSTEQVTIHENSTSYGKYRVRPRVLVDVSRADTSATVLGSPAAFPLGVSPAGIQAMAHSDGEVATSRACARHGVPMAVSVFANYSVEQVTRAGREIAPPAAHAMQLYTMEARGLQERIVRRAEAAGAKALFITADSPVLGVRYNEHRNDFRVPGGLEFPMLEVTSDEFRAATHEKSFTGVNSDAHSWARDIPWLRSISKMQIWIKGVLTAEDVAVACEYGCDGVIVSNHGGRQLDGVPSTIDALPECVAAANGRIPIHIDGGIRTGTDIFKALALGAECCWVGRPALWGLAYSGEEGVAKMLSILHDEFRRCMQLAGCKSVRDITKASLGVVRPDGPLARL